MTSRSSALLTPKRIALWGSGLLVLSWFVYVHTMSVPGVLDRVGRVKGSDYVQFYVMGSMVLEGKTGSLYDPDAHLAEGRRRIDPSLVLYAAHPNYPPQVALAFAPLALLPFVWSLDVFLVLTLAAYAASVWIVWRECPALARHGRLVAIVAAASPLLFALLRYGQASAFTLLVWSLAFAALNRNHRFTAGLVLGCLAYKPQLGIVLAVVVVAVRQWRVVAGALSMIVAQLGVGWLAVGSSPMRDYMSSLWTLMWNPALVQLYPSEVHSARGFFQLLIPSAPIVALCFGLTFVALLVLAVRTWASRIPLPIVYGQIVLLTVLASPHLITYDLLLLTFPLLVFANWTIAHADHRFRATINALLVVLYFAPFSGQIIARLTNVQVSAVAMALLAWRMYSVCRTESSGELVGPA
jgi:hypothetical protein